LGTALDEKLSDVNAVARFKLSLVIVTAKTSPAAQFSIKNGPVNGLPGFCLLTPFLSKPAASMVSVDTVSFERIVRTGSLFRENEFEKEVGSKWMSLP